MKKTVLITGAANGIGRETALLFAAKNYQLVINAVHDTDGLNSLKDTITREYHCDCLALMGDIGDYHFVEHLFDCIRDRFDHIDILVNNAGISYVGLLSEMDPSSWDHLVSTNLSALFYTSKQAIPAMVHQQSGRIINISSIWGLCGASCEVAYSATKGGVNSFTRALAKELAPSHIQVNAIACGVIDTRMNSCFSEEEQEALKEEIPAGRFGLPKEVASLILSLSEEHSYLTGQIITLDGGYL